MSVREIFEKAAVELAVFLAQTAVFALVAIFTSDLLRSEDRLTKHFESKFNDSLHTEFWLTLLSVMVVLGVLALMSRLIKTRRIIKISDQVIHEIPRTIYFFGSSVSGLLLASALQSASVWDSSNSSEASAVFATLALLYATLSFLLGLAMRLALERTTPETVTPVVPR